MYLQDKIESIAFFPIKGEKFKIITIIRRNIIKDLIIRLELEKRKKNIYRPYKIWYREGGQQKFIKYKDFLKILRSIKNVYIPRLYEKELNNIMNMLKDFQIQYRVVEICRHCVNKDKLTIMSPENCYLYYNEFICRNCALKEVGNEFEFFNIKPNKQLLNNLGRLLDKFRDVNKIMDIIKPGFIAAKNREFTLYDVLEPHKDKRKIHHHSIDELNLPESFVKILKKYNIELLPVQDLAIENGLLNNENLLIVAPTSTGKTLCGELAGIPKALNGGVMVYLSPLVALTNTKYEEFKRKYGEILNVAIRVGMSKIDVRGEDLVIIDSDIENADIICASYEAFDYIIRSGEYRKIKNIKTIIIDEIQTLGDEERGVELDGLISRLRILFPDAQFIGLSATIANAKELAKSLGLKPVIYDSRPVPVERHLVLCKSDTEKNLNLIELIKSEMNYGATIIFTNSRYGAYKLSKFFKRYKLNIPAYHSGLSYFERKSIENKLERNEIPGVVATYALGAGVDLPVSQVIFYSMRMGRDYLDNNMFLQMAGRAGRYKRHNRGKLVLLAEVGAKFFGSDKTEDQIALSLLNAKEDEIKMDAEPEEIEAQVLASISAGMDFKKLEQFYDQMLSSEEEFHYLLRELYKKHMLEIKDNKYYLSKIGKATAMSFFIPDETLYIINELSNNRPILEIAVELNYFSNIYIDNKLKDELSRILKINIPSLFFSGIIFDLFNFFEKFRGQIPKNILDILLKWQKKFSCEHEDKPYCDCGLMIANLEILDLRLSGFSPKEISNYFKNEYNLLIYPGDIFKMLDDIIHRLNGIKRIANSIEMYDKEEEINQLIEKIERPYPLK